MFLSIFYSLSSFQVVLNLFIKLQKRSHSILIKTLKYILIFERFDNFKLDNFYKCYILHAVYTFIFLNKILPFPLYMQCLFFARFILLSCLPYHLRYVHCFCLNRLPHKLITHMSYSLFPSLSLPFFHLTQFSLTKNLKTMVIIYNKKTCFFFLTYWIAWSLVLHVNLRALFSPAF